MKIKSNVRAGKGTKSSDTTFQTDKYGEFSHPAPVSGIE